jgi:hypothetical protein
MQFKQFSVILLQRCLCLTILWAGISASFSQSISETGPLVSVPPPPQPAPVIAPPPAAPISPFLSGPPDRQRYERAKPQIEVWRTGSDVPQKPKRRGSEGGHVLIATEEPFVLVLQFDRLLAGNLMEVMADENTTVQSAASMQVDRNGQVVLSARLNAAQRHGRIAFRIDGITTVLSLDRAPLEAVTNRENSEEQPGQ